MWMTDEALPIAILKRENHIVATYQIRKLCIAHAPGMPGTFSPPLRVNDPDMHHGTCVTHVPWCMPRSLTSGFLWSQWRGKGSRHSRRMRNPRFYVSVKRPMGPLFVRRYISSKLNILYDIVFQVSLGFVTKCPINNKPFVNIMTRR